MGKLILDVKDDKFIVSITPYLENTFVIDEVEITEEAKSVLFDRQTGKPDRWKEKIFKE